MAQPVYKLFVGKPTEAWYQLSREERDSVTAKMMESLEKIGVKNVVFCDSSWSSEQWAFFGVEEYPDIEAVQKHAEDLTELNWLRYMKTMSVLGTKWEPPK
ncbi:unnamed protein product [marine sediment metagenome]|uniref:ABM domain-containing protein n=1 Tax=marine sediment metagenome TaxID=412755 RepID=X1R0A6_9ZZZZ